MAQSTVAGWLAVPVGTPAPPISISLLCPSWSHKLWRCRVGVVGSSLRAPATPQGHPSTLSKLLLHTLYNNACSSALIECRNLAIMSHFGLLCNKATRKRANAAARFMGLPNPPVSGWKAHRDVLGGGWLQLTRSKEKADHVI